ncbi:hypothetical protein F5882DRAFT_377458 [Hyaloscypha sp. PMI_1271]|nr:hypothetical protein F5882DRAFT_377458 [Hyaloscypha sp. PMI_1271]
MTAPPFTISLPLPNTNVTAGFAGFLESDKTISIVPEHWTSTTSSSDALRHHPRLWQHPLGRDALPRHHLNPKSSFLSKANTTRPLAYAISIDAKPTTAQYVPIVDLGTMPGNWKTAVQNAGYSYTTKHAVTAGAYVLNLWAVEPGVVFQKIVVDLGAAKTNYLGPPESMRIGFRQKGGFQKQK